MCRWNWNQPIKRQQPGRADPATLVSLQARAVALTAKGASCWKTASNVLTIGAIGATVTEGRLLYSRYLKR
jgi:hypothetical protein